MVRLSQFGVAISVLGMVLSMMALFPGVTGIEPAAGIGIVQIFTLLTGFGLLILGGLIYVKFAFYPTLPDTLPQQIGVRLALTGLILSGFVGLSDILGFGSHPAGQVEPFLGSLQAIGIVLGFVMSAVGVLIYALTGDISDAPMQEE